MQEVDSKLLENLPEGARVSFWLLPTEECRAEWMPVIEDLAGRYDGPLFEPHVTIYVTYLSPEDEPARLVETVAGKSAPFSLACTGMDFTDRFTQTCFLTFELNDTLEALTGAFLCGSTIPDDYALMPHMSLLYGRLSDTERKEIRSTIKLPEKMRFDGIRAVYADRSTQSKEDVAAWRSICAAGFLLD